VWGYSLLAAGLAFTPGALMAAAFVGPAGRMPDRVGHRRVIAPGTLLFSGATLWLLVRAGEEAPPTGACGSPRRW
jgi:MFS family permease